MPAFTVDWFSHNISGWQRVFDSLGWLKSDKVLQGLEVGSWEGQSACWLLENVCCSQGSRLVCIDTWVGAGQYGPAAQGWGLSEREHQGSLVFQRFNDNILATGTSEKVVVLRQPSWVALASLFSTHLDTFDVVYIDGSHWAKDVLTDAVMAWRLLKEGGVMILDDYEWHQVVQLPPEQTPKKAIDAFLDIFIEELHILVLDYQCIVQKHSTRQASTEV